MNLHDVGATKRRISKSPTVDGPADQLRAGVEAALEQLPTLATCGEVAAAAGVNVRTVARWIEQGEIVTVSFGRSKRSRPRVLRSSVIDFIVRQTKARHGEVPHQARRLSVEEV